MKNFERSIFRLAFGIGIIVIFVLGFTDDNGFQKDIVYTHMLERIGRTNTILFACFVVLLAILSKLWDISDFLNDRQDEEIKRRDFERENRSRATEPINPEHPSWKPAAPAPAAPAPKPAAGPTPGMKVYGPKD